MPNDRRLIRSIKDGHIAFTGRLYDADGCFRTQAEASRLAKPWATSARKVSGKSTLLVIGVSTTWKYDDHGLKTERAAELAEAGQDVDMIDGPSYFALIDGKAVSPINAEVAGLIGGLEPPLLRPTHGRDKVLHATAPAERAAPRGLRRAMRRELVQLLEHQGLAPLAAVPPASFDLAWFDGDDLHGLVIVPGSARTDLHAGLGCALDTQALLSGAYGDCSVHLLFNYGADDADRIDDLAAEFDVDVQWHDEGDLSDLDLW